MIDLKASEWKETDMAKYLRPETLFNRTKFEGYLAEASPSKLSTQSILAEEQIAAGWQAIDGKPVPPMPTVSCSAPEEKRAAQRDAYYQWMEKYDRFRSHFGSEIVD